MINNQHKHNNPKLILFIVMLVSFLGTIGIALPYPVLAPYFINYPANELTHFMGFHPKLLLGFSLAIYPLGMLIGSIYIGALSDHFGRRRVLLITLFGSVIGYMLTAIAIYNESFIFFIISRFITGICEGNIAIARAIAIELHPKIHRTQALSLIYSATYTGWMLGPVLGGFLMVYGVAEVFVIAGIGMAIAILLTWFMISKDIPSDVEHIDFWHTIRKNNSLTLLKNKEILPMFWFYFFYAMGLNAFYDFYPVWFVDYFNADGKVISLATICLTIVMIIVSSFYVTKLQKRFGEYYVILCGAGFLSLILLIQPFLGFSQTFFIFALIGGIIAVTNGMIPSYLSNYFGHLGQGKVMGLQTSTFCITNVIIAIFGGALSILDSIYVLILGSILVMFSVFVLWKNKVSQLNLISKFKQINGIEPNK
ncbi:MAG: MFS transporter [Marinicellaceae bacterium]